MRHIYYWRDVIGHSEMFTPYADLIAKLLRGEHASLSLEKLRIPTPTPIYSIRINKDSRLLFTTYEGHLCLLDVVLNHDYAKSRFLRNPGVLRAFLRDIRVDPGIAMAVPVVTESDFVVVSDSELAVLSRDSGSAPVMHPLDYYQNRLIRFSTDQEGVFSTPLPAVVHGPAGSGKSCVALSLLSQYVRDHQEEVTAFPIVYISRSDALVSEMRRLWVDMTQGGVDDDKVQFKTYQQLMLESGVGSIGDDIVFFEWYEENIKGFVRSCVGGLGSTSSLLTPKDVLQEFRIRCGYENECDYMALGERRTGIDVIDRAYICAVYRAFCTHLTSTGQTISSLHVFSARSPYQLVVVDEAQDLSYGQLQGLYHFSGGLILYLLGEHQVLFDGKSRLPYLKDLLYRETRSDARMIELKASYRCSERVSAVASALIQLKYRVTGGASDKLESSSVVVSSERMDTGEALWLLPRDEAAIALFVAEAQQGRLAVVTLPSYVSEAKSRFCTPLVFTPSEIKGLEFDTVVVWRWLDDKQAHQACSKMGDLSSCSSKRHRAKSGEGDETHVSFFNELITAVTRARTTLVVVQDRAHSIVKMVDDLMPCFGRTVAPRASSGEDSLQTWSDAERMLRAVGDIARADEIVREKLSVERCLVSPAVRPQDLVSVLFDDKVTDTFHEAIAIIKEWKRTGNIKKDHRSRLSVLLSADGSEGVEDTLVYSLIQSPETLSLLLFIKDKQGALFQKIPNSIWFQAYKTSCTYPKTLIHDLVTTKRGRTICEVIFSSMNPKSCNKEFPNIAAIDHPNALWPYLVNTKDGLVILKYLCEKRSKIMAAIISKSAPEIVDIHLVLKALVADLNEVLMSDSGVVVACVAATHRQIGVLQVLHTLGVDINQGTPSGFTSAFIAAHKGDVDMLYALKAMGADLNKANIHGATPTYIAAYEGKADVISTLATLGASLDLGNIDGVTPACIAAQNHHTAVITLLKGFGANFNIASNKGHTPLFIAAKQGFIDVMEAIGNEGVDINQPNHKGFSPTLVAAKQGDVAVLRALKALGADLNKASRCGMTPSFAGVFYGHINVVDFFIEEGVSFDIPYFVSPEILTDMCLGDDKQIASRLNDKIRELLAAGYERNQIPILPIDIASIMGHDDIVTRLRSLRVSPSSRPSPISIPPRPRRAGTSLLSEFRSTIDEESISPLTPVPSSISIPSIGRMMARTSLFSKVHSTIDEESISPLTPVGLSVSLCDRAVSLIDEVAEAFQKSYFG